MTPAFRNTFVKQRRWALLASAVTVLGGCAVSPGMNLGANVDGLPTTPGDDQPPAGALTRITAELVRQQRSVAPVDMTEVLKPFLIEPTPYRIGAGDVLGIVVWGNPDFSSPTGTGTDVRGNTTSGFVVSASGTVQVPFVGPVRAAGLTLEEFGQRITSALASQVRNPQVTVDVRSYRSARVYIDGEVSKPGQQSIDNVPMTLPEAIDRAGGLTKSADRSNVAIIRGTQVATINLDRLISQGIDPNRIVLAKGDTVRVPNLEESRLYVLGEVAAPGPKLMRKGRLSLGEALGDSGGISSFSGDPRQVYVVRAADPTKPTIFHIDVSNPVFLALADGFELRPRDVVYVDPVSLVRWNRVVSLILPSAAAVQNLATINNLNSLRN